MTLEQKTKFAKSKDVLEIVRTIVEIVALIVAGIWAYSKYLDIEKPLLALRLKSNSDLGWYQTRQPDSCLARFGVVFKNIGTTPIQIDRVTIRAWIIDIPLSAKPMTYIDPLSLIDKMPTIEKQFADTKAGGLLGSYPVDVEKQIDFNFIFKKQESKVALFSAYAAGPGMTVEESRWSFICDLSTQKDEPTKQH